MSFTGERVIPGQVDADLFNEHWARYLFADVYAGGKTVLDVACGSGYGSALLARTAARVTGADISPEAIEYARRHYASRNTRFVLADCGALPFGVGCFDLVVAFEIIEHIGDAASFLNELQRVLAPDGLLLLSTPNRLYYTDDRGEVNPFHEQEYSYSEFESLLRRFFPHCSILLENHVAGLLVADAQQAAALARNPPLFHQQDGKEDLAGPQRREREAYYMIALCSARALPAARPLLYVPSSGNVLRERETHIRQLEGQLAEARQERDAARRRVAELDAELVTSNRWAQELDRQLSEKDAYILKLQQDYDEKVSWAKQLDEAIAQAQRDLEHLQREFEERTAWALRLDKELGERSADLGLLYGSRWYRLGKRLRLSPVPISDRPPEGG
jgi:SAM-dependent methyltransferase